MKPELEQLLDREFMGEEAAELEREAEETALAEYEAEQPLENYETPVLRVNPAELPARNYDTIEELLSVRELVIYNQEYSDLDEKIEKIERREYNHKLRGPLTGIGVILGGSGVAAASLSFNDLLELYINHPYLGVKVFLLAISFSILISGGLIAGGVGGNILNDYITNNSKKKKQFEKQKEIDLAKTNQRKQKLYEQLTSRNKPLKGNIILFNSNQTGYSLGYVQAVNAETINVQQEYVIEEDLIKDQRKPIHKLKPIDFIYVLTPDHDLSADDLAAMDGEAITCQIDGRTEFGFTKVGGEEVKLYTDINCEYLTSTHKLEEISGIRRLMPKRTSETAGYRVSGKP